LLPSRRPHTSTLFPYTTLFRSRSRCSPHPSRRTWSRGPATARARCAPTCSCSTSSRRTPSVPTRARRSRARTLPPTRPPRATHAPRASCVTTARATSARRGPTATPRTANRAASTSSDAADAALGARAGDRPPGPVVPGDPRSNRTSRCRLNARGPCVRPPAAQRTSASRATTRGSAHERLACDLRAATRREHPHDGPDGARDDGCGDELAHLALVVLRARRHVVTHELAPHGRDGLLGDPRG